jgi:hypothetical protein
MLFVRNSPFNFISIRSPKLKASTSNFPIVYVTDQILVTGTYYTSLLHLPKGYYSGN